MNLKPTKTGTLSRFFCARIFSGDTKTKKAHTLPLTAQACAFLARYRSSQAASGYDGAYLFPGAHGQPLSETPAQLAFSMLAGDVD